MAKTTGAAVAVLVAALVAAAASAPAMGPAKPMPQIPLYNAAQPGLTMPAVGLGTFGYGIDPNGDGGEFWNYTVGYAATTSWLRLGGRRIDSASSYLTQQGVGQAIVDSGMRRSDLFVTSKTTIMGYNDTMANWAFISKMTQLDYVDLLLIHWPGPCATIGLKPKECRQQAWAALSDLYKAGKAKAIGVSNFEQNHIEELLEMGGLVPSVNQVEFHPYWHEDGLREWCQSKNITFQSYSPLGAPDHMAFSPTKWPVLVPDQPTVKALAAKHGKSPGQIVLRWAWQQGVSCNPRTMKEAHMTENMEIFDFSLSDDEVASLNDMPNSPKKGENKVCPDPNHIP